MQNKKGFKNFFISIGVLPSSIGICLTQPRKLLHLQKTNKKNEFICAKLAKKLVIVPCELKFYYIYGFNWIYRHFKLTCRPTLRAGLWRTKRQRTLATRPANPTEVKSIPWTAKSKRSKCVQLAIRELLVVNKLKEKLKRKCTRSKYIGSFRRCCTLDQLQSMRFDDWLTDGQKRKEVISLLYQNGRISKI